MTHIGIDISKATFVAAYPQKNGYRTLTFPNTPHGCLKFIRTLESGQHHCVMEATGNYGFLLLYLLHKADITVSMENPKKIKNFARTMMSVTKTDEADARLIALYGERMQPLPFRMPADSIMMLRQKRAVLRMMKKQRNAGSNLMQSMQVLPKQDPMARSSLFDRQMALLTSIKGIGTAIASALIIATGGFTYFDNAKQVSRYLGLCPTIQQSGTSVHVRGNINRNGDEQLRAEMYIASWSASRHNTACKECYNRLRQRGKPKQLALIAVANKLIRQAFSVVKKGTPYQDGFVSDKPSTILTT